MKKSLLLLTFIASCLFCTAQVTPPNWLLAFGSPPTGGSNYEEGEGIAAGTDGYIYVGSRYVNNGTLVSYGMPGHTISPPNSSASTNVSCTKLTNQLWGGTGSWSLDVSPSGYDYGGNIGMDKSNNAYVVGVTNSGNGWFCTQTLSSGSPGGWQYTNSSNLGTWGVPNGVCVDNSGNAYVCGDYSNGSITIGTTLSYLNGTHNINTGFDGFLCQLEAGTGTPQWAIALHGAGCEVQPYGVAIDQSGYLWVCGGYTGTPTFGTITLAASGSSYSLFVAKIESSNGTVLAVYTAQNAGPGVQLCIDSCSNIYVAGDFQGTATWGSISKTSTASAGVNCGYVTKLRTSDGQFQWVQTGMSTGSNFVQANGISIDKNWDLTIDGRCSGTATFAGRTFSSTITGISSGSTFIAKYASGDGSLLYAKSGGGPATCTGYYVATDANRQSYCTGTYGNTSTPVFGSNFLPIGSGCQCNIYVAKIDSTPSLSIVPEPQTSYCAGMTYNLPYIAIYDSATSGVFTTGNVFTAELSDATGSFESGGTVIGSVSSTTSGSISITIPSSASGTNYLIRIEASKPNYCSIVRCSSISINNNLSLTVTPTTPIVCKGSSITLKVSGGGSSYTWSAANTADTIVASPLTDTTYSVTSTSGLCTGSTTVAVTVNPTPVVTVSALPTAVCAGGSTVLSAYGAGSYSWSAGGTTSSVSVSPVSSAIKYVVTGTSSGCSSKDSLTVTINPLPTIGVLPVNPQICAGGMIPLTANGAGATGNYKWTPTYGLKDSLTAATIGNPSITTTYTVIGTTALGCVDSTLVTLTVNPNPTVTVTPSLTVCEGSSANLTATGGGTYSWSSGETSSTISVIPTGATQYMVSVSNGSCSAKDSTTVIVNPAPANSVSGATTILIGTSTPLSTDNTSTGNTYSWTNSASLSCSNCPNPIANPIVTTMYVLTVTDNLGCSKEDSALVTVKEICGPVYVPTAFSPNGDGNNDVFKVMGNCIKGMDLIVYDRWGNVVFETNSPASVWDGTCKGRNLNTGTYVYSLEATDQDNNQINKKGNITLIR